MEKEDIKSKFQLDDELGKYIFFFYRMNLAYKCSTKLHLERHRNLIHHN